MELPPPLTLEEARRHIAIRHLDQLSNSKQISQNPPDEEPVISFPSLDAYLKMLKDWTNEHSETIKIAVQNRAFGGPYGSPINWNYAFLPFMESMAVYLRDWGLVLKSIDLYRKGQIEQAIETYKKSTEKIQELADMWDMDFDMVCDLTHNGSAEHKWWNGPYCGIFHSRDSSAPFLGIAFKGTDPRNYKDWLVDLKYATVKASPGILYGTNVSEGVYNGLFGHFKDGRPFDMVLRAINDLLTTKPSITEEPAMIHATGHSLGGSYSSLCFLQLTEPASRPSKASIGDLYTFGAPRNGLKDLATAAKDALGSSTGSTWRIANVADGIPKVPPVIKKDYEPFNHIDAGWSISPSAAPQEIPSEIGTTPPPHFPTLAEWKGHAPWEYHKAMKEALVTKGDT